MATKPPRITDTFANKCFDSLARGRPMMSQTYASMTCMDYILSSDMQMNAYQFGRDDIDFTKDYCRTEKNYTTGDGGSPISCISKICDYHARNSKSLFESMGYALSKSARSNILQSDVVHDNMIRFWNKYIDNIKETKCIDGLSCLNTLLETDLYLANESYVLSKDDLEFEGCVLRSDYNRPVPCIEKIISDGMRYNKSHFMRSGVRFFIGNELLKTYISRFKNDDVISELLTKHMNNVLSFDISGSGLTISESVMKGIPLEQLSNMDCNDPTTPPDENPVITCAEKMLITSMGAYDKGHKSFATTITFN